MAYESGVCGFCGTGGGWLGEQGDERSQHLHGAVRTGEPGHWKYEKHPNSTESRRVLWCGGCDEGLAHKYQRLDDHNLNTKYRVYKLWNEMDGPRWSLWEMEKDEPGREAAKAMQDDPGVHIEKLSVEREIGDMWREIVRRVQSEYKPS